MIMRLIRLAILHHIIKRVLKDFNTEKESIMPQTRKRAMRKISRPNTQTMAHIGRQMEIQTAGHTLCTTLGIGLAVLTILGLTLVIIIGHGTNIASASGGGPSSGTQIGYGSLNHPKGWCGNGGGQAACPTVDPGWFSVSLETPTVIATSIANSGNFVSMRDRFGYTSLDTPVLVHAYAAHTGKDYYDDDHWVVSVRNASGIRCGLFDFVYDRTHQRMRFASFGVLTPQDPHSGLAFPYTTASVAIAKLQSQRGLHVMVGTQPEMIFFPIDPSFPYLNSPVHNWSGGGNSAMNPMWHIVGSDGHDYFVGTDMNVHSLKDLPIAQGQP